MYNLVYCKYNLPIYYIYIKYMEKLMKKKQKKPQTKFLQKQLIG